MEKTNEIHEYLEKMKEKLVSVDVMRTGLLSCDFDRTKKYTAAETLQGLKNSLINVDINGAQKFASHIQLGYDLQALVDEKYDKTKQTLDEFFVEQKIRIGTRNTELYLPFAKLRGYKTFNRLSCDIWKFVPFIDSIVEYLEKNKEAKEFWSAG